MNNLHIPALLDGAWHELAFSAFRPGIEICTLSPEDKAKYFWHNPDERLHPQPDNPFNTDNPPPGIALLRYQPGASVPRHRHAGVETILVLAGSQNDEAGCYQANALVINPIGSVHSVWSVDGCVVLIQWDKPVEFLTE